jgi:hypothetical protein
MSANLRALRAFVRNFEGLSICEYWTGRLEGMLERPRRGSGDPEDVAKWRKMDRAWKRLIELGEVSK